MDTFNQANILDFFSKCVHATVVITGCVNILIAPVLILSSDVDWYGSEFLMHGLYHAPLFFSIWVSVLQLTYFNIYFVIDIIDIFGKRDLKKYHALCDKLHSAASYLLFAFIFPLSLLVTILFWAVCTWNREVLYPTVLDRVFHPQMNHIMHTYPPLIVLAYMMFFNKYEPPKPKTFSGLLTLLIIYTAILVAIKMRTGKWIYYFLDVITPFQANCVLSFCLFGSIAFFFLGYYLNGKMKVLREKINTKIKDM